MADRLVGISMVKNEADIVEAFVRHNLRFLDHLIVLDDHSADSTLDILRSLAAEGLPLTLVGVREPDPMFKQAQSTTSLAYEAFGKYGADHVFPLDADEFLRAPSKQALVSALAQADSEVMHLSWVTYVPDTVTSFDHPLQSLRWRVEADKPALPKIAISKRAMAAKNWRIGRGNHVFYRQQGKDLHWSTGQALSGVELAHLPFRSPEQLTAKAAVGWLARKLSYGPKATASSNSWHFRELFGRIMAGHSITQTDVRNYAIGIYALGHLATEEDLARVRLIEDPIGEAMPLRYTPTKKIDPLQLLAAWSSLLVDRVMHTSEYTKNDPSTPTEA